MARALIAIGSNVGDREANLARALASLSTIKGTRVVASATPVETSPERVGDGGDFLNSAALVETTLPPRALLEHLLEIEDRLGRDRTRSGRGPRVIDLDLILVGDLVRREPGLELPHPRFRSRRFVLEPAAEIAPDLVDPVTRRTVSSLLRLAPRPRAAHVRAHGDPASS